MARHRAKKHLAKALAAKLREKTEVTVGENTSDFQFSPFQVAEALVVYDQIESGWYDRSAPVSTDPNETEWLAYRRMWALRRALVAHAVEIAVAVSKEDPRAETITKRSAWCHERGLRIVRDKRETHFHCMFCDENLSTLGGSWAINDRLQKRLENHAAACAMMYLAHPELF